MIVHNNDVDFSLCPFQEDTCAIVSVFFHFLQVMYNEPTKSWVVQ